MRIGEANIKIDLDLRELERSLNEVTKDSKAVADAITKAFRIRPTGEGFKEVERGADRAEKEVKELGIATEKTQSQLLKLTAIEAGFRALSSAIRTTVSGVLELTGIYADAELVQEKLRGGLERLGDSSAFERLIKQANDLQNITPFSNDDITNMQAMYTTFGLNADMIERLTGVSLDLASAFSRAGDTGMDLTQVSILIGKAAGAELVGALSRVGIMMSDTQKKMLEAADTMERVSIISEIMSQNSNLTAEAFGKTLAGQMKIAENAMDDVRKKMGEFLAPAVQTVAKAVQNLANFFLSLPTAIQVAIGAIAALGVAILSLTAVIAVFDIATGGVLIIIGAIVTALAGVVVAIGYYLDDIREWINENQVLTGTLNNMKAMIDEAFDSLKNLWNMLTENIGVTASLGDVVKRVLSVALTVLIATLSNVVKGFTMVIKVMQRIVGVGQSVGSVIGSVISMFSRSAPSTLTSSIMNMISKVRAALVGLAKLMASVFGVKRPAGAPTTKVAEQSTIIEETEFTPTGSNNSGKSGNTGKTTTPIDEEKNALQELMKEYRYYLDLVGDNIALGEATLQDRRAILESYREQFNQLLQNTTNQEYIRDIENEIREIRKELLSIEQQEAKMLKERSTLKKSELEAIATNVLEEQRLREQAEQELAELTVRNSGTITEQKVFDINKRYDHEEARIREMYGSEDIADQLLMQLKIARRRELNEAEMEFGWVMINTLKDSFDWLGGEIKAAFGRVWESVFGQANSLVEQFTKFFIEKLLEVAATKIFTSIIDIATGGLFGFFGGLFNRGGYTGDGRDDEVAGIVHKNEYVVSSKGVNAKTLPLLESLNKGLDLKNLINIPSFELPAISQFSMPSMGNNAGNTVNVTIDGVSLVNQSLRGLSDTEWSRLVDRDILPQVSRGLKRVGKQVLDDKIY